MRPLHVAVVGAKSTGKSWLTQAVVSVLHTRSLTAQAVDDVVPQWCHRTGRLPEHHELLDVAQQQVNAAQLMTASSPKAWVMLDTPPLMTAVYSHLLFDDKSLYPMALAHQALYDITLVTGLDLSWVAEELQRDGAQLRISADNLVRQALADAGMPYRVVYGQGPRRLNNALLALGLQGEDLSAQETRVNGQFSINQGRSLWQCNECSDPGCEHKLFTRLIAHRTDG